MLLKQLINNYCYYSFTEVTLLKQSEYMLSMAMLNLLFKLHLLFKLQCCVQPINRQNILNIVRPQLT